MSKGLIVPVVSKYDNRGVKQAQSSVSALGKNITGFSKLASNAFAAVGIASLAAFGKNAVNTFMEDQKALVSLNTTLKNVGASFAIPEVDSFISKLQLATGVSEDQLRPAYQQLVTVTGDVYKSQKLLNLALNVSAGTTKDVGTVAVALSKAYLGNNTALSKLGVAVDKTTLATASYSEVINLLSTTYAGQAKAAAETYAGKMDRIKVAADEAKEVIGKGLVTAFETLSSSGGTSIESLTGKMDNFATSISNITIGLADMIKPLTDLGSVISTPDKSTVGGKIWGFISDKLTKNLVTGKRDAGILAQLSKRGAEISAVKPQIAGGERAFTDDIKQAYLYHTLETARLSNAARMAKLAAAAAAKAKAAAAAAKAAAANEKQYQIDKIKLIAEEMAKKAGFTVTTDIASINAVAAANLASKQKAAAVDEASRLAIEENQKALTAYANGADIAIKNAINNANNLTKAFDAANTSAGKIGGTIDQMANKFPGGTGATSTTGTVLGTSKVTVIPTTPVDLGAPSPTVGSTFGGGGGGGNGVVQPTVQEISVVVQGSVVTEQELVGSIMGAMNGKIRAGAKFFASAAAGL